MFEHGDHWDEMNNSKFVIFLGGHNSAHPLIKNTDFGYKQFLQNSGFTFTRNIDEADAAVFIELDSSQLSKARNDLPTILIRNEPCVVWPDNYKKKYLRRVNKVIDVGQPTPDGGFLPWPQDWTQVKSNSESLTSRLNKFALINGNKLGFIPGELYSLRRKCVNAFDEIDLFGTNWKIPLRRKLYLFAAEFYLTIKNGFLPRISSSVLWFSEPKNYFGAPESKFEILNNYRYSLVIENSMNYMSEKLFDALLARSIPVYVGPNIEKFGIPKDLVFQAEPNLQSIKAAMDSAKHTDQSAWEKNLNAWLNDPNTRETWTAEKVYKRIMNEIILFLNSQTDAKKL